MDRTPRELKPRIHTLENWDEGEIADKDFELFIKTYTDDRTGYDKLLADIAASHNPRTVTLVVWMAKHEGFIQRQFGIVTPLFFYIADTHHSSQRLIDYLDNNPALRPLFCDEALQYLTRDMIDPSEQHELEQLRQPEFLPSTGSQVDLDTVDGPERQWNPDYFMLDADDDEVQDSYDALLIHVLSALTQIEQCDTETAQRIANKLIILLLGGRYRNEHAITGFINRFAAEYVGEQLMQRLARAETWQDKLPILHELGKIKIPNLVIEDAGMTYCGARIELQDLPHDASHAIRLSAYGDIGTFTKNGEMNGHFSLRNLQSIEQQHFTAIV